MIGPSSNVRDESSIVSTQSATSKSAPVAALGTANLVISVGIVRGLSDRSYEKRKSAALDLEHIVKQDPLAPNVKAIIATLNSDFIASNQSNFRKGGLIGLAAVSIGLGQACPQYLDDLLPPVLLLMQDLECRCRYYSCEAMYNITKICRGHVLRHFNAIYDGLCTLHADPDHDVRNAASLLDRLMKDVVTESDQFDIAHFMPILQERILIKDSALRELNVGWIQVLDSVPDIDLLRYLPGILRGLFDILSDSNPAIGATVDEVLCEFLNEISASQPDTIEDMIPVLVQQSSGDFPAVTKHMALKWLESFVVLCGSRLLPQYPILINGLLVCMSDSDHESIRSQAESISNIMMQQVLNGRDCFPALEDLLRQLTVNLNLNRASGRLPILNWIQMLLQKHPEALLKSIDQLFPSLIQTLSDPSEHVVQVDLAVLAAISRDPSHFDDVFSHILHAFCSDPVLLRMQSSLIVRELSSLLSTKTVFCAIARLLPSNQDHHLESISATVQIINDLLLTSSELYEFRREVENCLQTREGIPLFTTLFKAWSSNPVATLSLCLLSQSYDLASSVVCFFADFPVTVGFLIEIDRLILLLESPVFIRLRLQLLEPQTFPSLVKALHGILMMLPSQGASFRSLATRLQSVSTIATLQFIPKATINPLASRVVLDQDSISELLEYFQHVQALYTTARLRALNEKRISSSTTIDIPY